MPSVSDSITVADSASVVALQDVTDTSTGADEYTLLITDGDWVMHLTHAEAGFTLQGMDGWGPAMAQFKSGGYHSAGTMGHGYQLRHTAFANVTESFTCILDFAEDATDDMVNQIDMLTELLQVRAPRYWTDRRNYKPVWLEKQMKGETGATYALINQGRVVLPRDTWDACTHQTGRLYPVQIIIDRQPFWLGAEPGTVESVVEISARQAWDYGLSWGVETTMPAGYIFCMVEDYDGNIWAGGENEVLVWNGTSWAVADTSPITPGTQVREAIRLQNGDLLFTDSARVIKRSAAGVWSTETSSPSGDTYGLIESTTGEVFAAESGIIWKRDTSGTWATDSTVPSGNVFKFVQDSAGRIYGAGEGEIVAQVDPWDDADSEDITVLLAAETDSAEQYNSGVFVPGRDRRLRIFNRNFVGLRYALDIPAGARVNECTIEAMLRSRVEGDDEDDDDNGDDDDASENLRVYCQAADDAAIFTTTDDDLSNRTLTGNYVDWQDDEDHARNTYISTPDLSHVLQEVIDRGGWEEGNHVVFLLQCDNLSYREDLENARPVYGYDGGQGEAPRLKVEYTTTDGSSGDWEVITTQPTADVRSLLYTGELLLAGDTGQIWGSDDDGETWAVSSTTPSGAVRSLYQDSQGVVWAGENGTILRSDDGGRNFSVASTLPGALVTALMEESTTGAMRAGEDGQILSYNFVDRVTLGATKTELDRVMVGNLHRTANITDVKIDDNGSFTDIFPILTFPQILLPATFAVNDALYVGVDTNQTDSGPFDNAMFDIATPMSATISYTLVWEYYNGAWTTLTCHDETNQLSEVGVRGVFWKQPSDWTTVAVDSVTGYWLRGRVSALSGTPTSPTQQNANIYSVAWPCVDVLENEVLGNVDSLIQLRLHNRSDEGGPGGSEPQLYASRVWCGVKRTEDHADFRAYLNFADEQNPPGVTVDVSVDPDSATSIEADSNLSSATGRRVFFDASTAQAGNGLSNWEKRVSIDLGPTVARDFYGTYKAFLRLKQEGGSAGEVNVRLKVVGGSGGMSYTTEPQETASTTDHELIMFHKAILLPVAAQMTPTELGDQTSIIVEINTEAGDADLYLYGLVLIPTDVMWFEVRDRANTAESTVENGRRLLIDPVTIPKFPTRAIVQNMATNANISEWSYDGNGRLAIPSGGDVRLWFLAARTASAGSAVWLSEPEVCHSISLSRTNRWLLGRSDA